MSTKESTDREADAPHHLDAGLKLDADDGRARLRALAFWRNGAQSRPGPLVDPAAPNHELIACRLRSIPAVGGTNALDESLWWCLHGGRLYRLCLTVQRKFRHADCSRVRAHARNLVWNLLFWTRDDVWMEFPLAVYDGVFSSREKEKMILRRY